MTKYRQKLQILSLTNSTPGHDGFLAVLHTCQTLADPRTFARATHSVLPGMFVHSWFIPWPPLDLQSNPTCSWSPVWPTLTHEHYLFPFPVLLLSLSCTPFLYIPWITYLFVVCQCPLQWSSTQAGTSVCFDSSPWGPVWHTTDDRKHLLNKWMTLSLKTNTTTEKKNSFLRKSPSSLIIYSFKIHFLPVCIRQGMWLAPWGIHRCSEHGPSPRVWMWTGVC